MLVRRTRPSDFEDIHDLTLRTYPHDTPWRAHELASHVRHFPVGQLVAVRRDTGRVVGMAASLLIRRRDYALDADYMTYTGGGLFENHDPLGDTLYAAEVMVDPDARGLGVGKRLYAARRALTRRVGARRIRAGARLCGYHNYADELSAKEYVDKVLRGELGDSTLSFQLKQGFHVVAVVDNYMRDPETLGHAAVIDWMPRNVRLRASWPLPGVRNDPSIIRGPGASSQSMSSSGATTPPTGGTMSSRP